MSTPTPNVTPSLGCSSSAIPQCSSSPIPNDNEDEMDLLMCSSPIPDDNEAVENDVETSATGSQDTSPSPVAVERDNDVNSETSLRRLPGVSRNEQAIIRCAAEKLKIHPYQRSLLQDFLKCTQPVRDAQLMMAMFVVDNKLDLQIAAAPPFSVTEPLHLNIKSFIIAVLLSSKLAAYKGTVPHDHVLALLMRDRLHIPNAFDRDPHASKVLKEHVNHELSQAQGKLKKLLMSQIKSGNDKHIFDLATALVNGTSCTVMVQLCGRVALFRKVYQVDASDSFWGTVDQELIKIRRKAANDPIKITRYFKAILDADQKKYTGDSDKAYSIPSSVTSTDTWQTEVDNLLNGASVTD